MTCPACGDSDLRKVLKHGETTAFRCKPCRHIFVQGGPPPRTLYDEEYYRVHYAPRAEALRRFFRAEAANLPPPRRGARLLDVGSGMGLFLVEAKAQGWSVLGVEPSTAGLSASQRAGLGPTELDGGVFKSMPLATGSFDLVTFWDSLAHIPDLHGALNEARRLLRPGGRVIVKTPHRPRRIFALARMLGAMEPRLVLPVVPLHTQIHHFTPTTLARALRSAGLEPVGSRWVNEVATKSRGASARQRISRAATFLAAMVGGHSSFIMEAALPATA